jgi:hypothetical protein
MSQPYNPSKFPAYSGLPEWAVLEPRRTVQTDLELHHAKLAIEKEQKSMSKETYKFIKSKIDVSELTLAEMQEKGYSQADQQNEKDYMRSWKQANEDKMVAADKKRAAAPAKKLNIKQKFKLHQKEFKANKHK